MEQKQFGRVAEEGGNVMIEILLKGFFIGC